MMPAPTHPFTPEPHDLGTLRDGRTIKLEPMTSDTARALGAAVATFGPWKHYNFSADRMTAVFSGSADGAVRYEVQVSGTQAGAVMIRSPWLTGPYLQILAMLPSFQGSGAGAAFLKWYEQTARSAGARSVWLCVAGYNTSAERLYRRAGYQCAGTLPDLLRAGDDELLMRKRLA